MNPFNQNSFRLASNNTKWEYIYIVQIISCLKHVVSSFQDLQSMQLCLDKKNIKHYTELKNKMIKLINASNQIFFINLGHFIPKVPHVSDEDMTKRSNMVFFNTYRLDCQRPKVESLLNGREIRC